MAFIARKPEESIEEQMQRGMKDIDQDRAINKIPEERHYDVQPGQQEEVAPGQVPGLHNSLLRMMNGFDPRTILQLVQATPNQAPVFGEELNAIKQQYPVLAPYDWSLLDSRGKKGTVGQLEFYAPEESESPTPGRPTIEVFNPELKGQALQTAIFGDMLHHLPSVDPKWSAMRDQFSKTLTPEQLQVDEKAYREAQKEGEKRSFADWMKQSRLDAYIRGKLTPDAKNEWRDVYTPQQAKLLEQMLSYLKGGR